MIAKTYIVHTQGYTNCPEFPTLDAARALLSELVAESLAAARRKSSTAHKHKLGEDNYAITLGSDRRSTLWAAHSISCI